jgi:Co/Zn/Cd efflux system component
MAIYTTIPILKESFNFLLDGCDDIHIIDEIEEELRDNQTVEKVESLRVWSTTRGKYYGALRVKVR